MAPAPPVARDSLYALIVRPAIVRTIAAYPFNHVRVPNLDHCTRCERGPVSVARISVRGILPRVREMREMLTLARDTEIRFA
jgi:hypothetical protein